MPITVAIETIGELNQDQLARRVPLVSTLTVRNELASTAAGYVLLAVDGGGTPTRLDFELEPGADFLRMNVDIDRGDDLDVLLVTAVAVVDGTVAGSDARSIPVSRADEEPQPEGDEDAGGRFQRLRRSLGGLRLRGRGAAHEPAEPEVSTSEHTDLVAAALARAVGTVERELTAERDAADRAQREAAERAHREAAARELADQAAELEAAAEAEREEAEREEAERAERAAAQQAQRAAAERAAHEAAAQAERDAAEQAAHEAAAQAERDAAEQAAHEAAAQAERDAAEHAAREAAAQAEREAAEREAAEQAARDAAEHAAREAADQAQREAAEREATERAEREAAEQAARAAADQAQREAAEREATGRAEREAAEQAAREAAARELVERDAAELEAATQAERAAADRAAAERQARETAAPTAEPPSAPAPRHAAEIPDRPVAPLPGESVFEPWNGGWRGGRVVLDNLSVTANKRLVTAALVEGINAEGPIHIDRLTRLVAAAFEVRKVSPARVSDLAALVPRSAPTTEDGAILWPARLSPLEWNEFRGAVDTEPRPTEHIARRELANAMVAVVTDRGPTSRAELFGITRRLFGGRRVTPAIEARMVLALDEAVGRKRLAEDGDQVTSGG